MIGAIIGLALAVVFVATIMAMFIVVGSRINGDDQ
jgi:hypothetical protein